MPVPGSLRRSKGARVTLGRCWERNQLNCGDFESSKDPGEGVFLIVKKMRYGLSYTNTNLEKYPVDQSFTLLSSGLICWACLSKSFVK